MAELTEKKLQSLKAEDKGKKHSDGGSLQGMVRVKADGKVSVFFTWRYKFEGKAKDLACGTWPNEKLAAIRKTRDQARRVLEEGKDPALERKAEKLEAKAEQQAKVAELQDQLARLTVNGLFDRWVKLELAKRKESSRNELIRSFQKDVLPVIGKFPAEDVTKAHVMKVLDNILARGARRLANRTLSELRQMFGFGYARDIVKHDPTHRLKKADIGGKETERDRVLSEDEIREFARKIPGANLYRPSECAIWIMLSTGCRVGDLMKATWDEIDFEARTWAFTPEKDKTHIKRTHTVFLSDFTLRQFERLRGVTGKSVWLYPDKTGIKPVCKKSITKQIGDRQRTEALKNRSKLTGALLLSGGTWTPHDLRRTATTLMVELGVLPDVAHLCTYHLEQDRIKRTYNRSKQQTAQAEAWRVLGERLDLLTRENAQNVTVIDFRRTVYR
ncbi:tyrosine-type recombinase/integrase [Methylocaldum sp. GT1BB]|jgi:integrase|uniref:tyrosine-type recombinase/integrase n=1 Tax=Methylocaldum sp. GT1BB TaxID=3438963 RepID=UPI003DA0915C